MFCQRVKLEKTGVLSLPLPRTANPRGERKTMKITKRISVSLLVLVMVLSAVLAIPASAWVEPEDDTDTAYSSKTCSCSDPGFAASYQSRTYADGDSVLVITSITHRTAGCQSCEAYHSASIWYYPSSTSYAYNIRTVTGRATNQGDEVLEMFAVAASGPQATGTQVFFCVEARHQVKTTCTASGIVTYSGSTQAGEPALK